MMHDKICNAKLYCPPNLIDREDVDGNLLHGEWREQPTSEAFTRITSLGTNTYRNDANHMREQLALYFVGEGAIPFQWDK